MALWFNLVHRIRDDTDWTFSGRSDSGNEFEK